MTDGNVKPINRETLLGKKRDVIHLVAPQIAANATGQLIPKIAPGRTPLFGK